MRQLSGDNTLRRLVLPWHWGCFQAGSAFFDDLLFTVLHSPVAFLMRDLI